MLYLLVITVGTDLGFSYALSAVINNWFYRRKALAMSAFQAIDSVLPAGLVGVIALAIAAWGWQTTARVMGLVLVVVILPLAACITERAYRSGGTRAFRLQYAHALSIIEPEEFPHEDQGATGRV